MIDNNKMIFSLTVEEFMEMFSTCMNLSLDDNTQKNSCNLNVSTQKHYVFGLKGLCSLLGCSLSTASRIKKSGVIDAATYQRNKIIVFDADLVLDILSVKHRLRGNRKGYHK